MAVCLQLSLYNVYERLHYVFQKINFAGAAPPKLKFNNKVIPEKRHVVFRVNFEFILHFENMNLERRIN